MATPYPLPLKAACILLALMLMYFAPIARAEADAEDAMERTIEERQTLTVETKEIELERGDVDLGFTLFIPKKIGRGLPAVVFLPGVMAEIDQYSSYANSLAMQGMLVAVHHWYSPLTSDVELARDAKLMAAWMVESLAVNQKRIGIVGHSFGAKDAILSEGIYGGYAAIVAIDPDNSGDLSAADTYTPLLKAPLLIIGAEVGWQAPDICAPLEANYKVFFEKSPPGTLELTLKGADHVQMLDDPERFGYTICRVGEADSSKAHDLTLHATLAFLKQHLMAGPNALETLPKPLIRIMQSGGPQALGEVTPPQR